MLNENQVNKREEKTIVDMDKNKWKRSNFTQCLAITNLVVV